MPPTATTGFSRLTADLMRCLACRGPVSETGTCRDCGRVYEDRDGIIEAMGPLTGRNGINARFYDGPSWRRFRPWERAFLLLQGGNWRARRPILRHLPQRSGARILEVGIGDGDNVALLPRDWEVHGVDLARSRLEACRARFPDLGGRLVLAEAERLPYRDGVFDACLSVGGFTFYGDHQAALREMRRVTRPGGPVVVADEVPWLCRLGIGHLLGQPRIDAWWLRFLGLESEFIDMVLGLRIDLDALVFGVDPEARKLTIWSGLGYCFVSRSRSAGIEAHV